MKDIIKYIKREIRIRKDHLEYCEKYNDPRQAKFIRNKINKLETSINILSAEVDTNNETKALNICDVSQQRKLLREFTHRYFTLSEAKPENGKPCIVNNGVDNYHIAFWDEKINGFVNQTGYLQKEFDRWLYLPINGG